MSQFYYRPMVGTEQLPTRKITFKSKDEFAIILPAGVTIEGKTFTTHKKAASASRWATHHKGLCINSIIVDRKANIYAAYRDTTNGKYKLEPTGEILAGFEESVDTTGVTVDRVILQPTGTAEDAPHPHGLKATQEQHGWYQKDDEDGVWFSSKP